MNVAAVADSLPTEVFPFLASPATYQVCRLNLSKDPAYRKYWVGMFSKHFSTMVDEAMREGLARGCDEKELREKTSICQEKLNAVLDDFVARPEAHENWNIMTLCLVREELLRSVGIDDPYRLVKERENAAALKHLPSLLEELDKANERDLPILLAQGMFAGNIFDLGAASTQAMFENGKSVDFRHVRAKLKPRPWLVDGLDAWLDRLRTGKPHNAAVLFVDNAGCDIALGMIPFARYLLSRGTGVILAANQTPSLNDVTYDELVPMIQGVAAWDPIISQSLDSGLLEIVSSGNGAPLIDLTKVSPALVEAVTRREVDLVVLEGMGRGVESNFDAQLSCETIKVAMIKDQGVASALGGSLYDLVFRYDAIR